MARRVEGRNRFRDFFLCSLPVAFIMAFLYVLVSSSIFGFYAPHIHSPFDNKESNFINKNLDWREKAALESFPSLFSKEMLDALNGTATTSDSDTLSIDAIRKKKPSLSWRVEDEVESSEDHMVDNFGHGTWTREGGGQVLNDTPEKLYQRRMRQERREKRAKDLMKKDNHQALEKAAIQRSRSIDSVAPGNYSIWRNEYHKSKNFEDLLRLMQDQIIMVRVYTSLAKMTNNLALHKELEAKLAKMEEEQEESINIDQQQSRVLDTIRDMGQLLARARKQLYDCNLVTNKLRAMLQTAEEELVSTQTHTTFLNQLASKSIPHAIHCLTMTLNLEYSLLPAPMRHFPRMENLENPDLYHYALFSDNVLAASVVVNSTVTNANDPSLHVFHIVTDKLNFGAMSMWFLLNPPKEATVHVQRFEDFSWLNSSYSPVLKQLESEAMKRFYFKTERSESAESGAESLKYRYPKYLSMLNHLRFYIPKIFPKLDKILFLDDDVVVQKDLAPLWSVDLKGKVNGAVETCGVTFHRLKAYLNFSDQHVSEKFDPEYCGWAYGMNIFDLKEWRKHNITETYHFWQNLNENRTLWKLGTLPPGLITFYNLTLPLQKKWHLLGLGYNREIDVKKIERSAVIHFNGHSKPWTELGISKYQPYWTKYTNLEHPYISSCRLLE
ncbi:putative galacturonosyltransferase 2 isoform X1 [Brassica rapa]|uniref:putative galacturonosyltransferase 2 isoform X1 n=1 Tax=Brassica campestris TaxID=3711 RepID=UPI00142DB98E|nr:putative galacturonosyltransferase 2 isoform X1 [Brassica rapa]